MEINIVGAGLAGCEAAYQLAQNGINVNLYEMKPKKFSKAHSHNGFAELVCSNSLKAMRIDSASGMLKEEMRMLNSLIIEIAEKNSVPAGGALAVDRVNFSNAITNIISSHKNINIINDEVLDIPKGITVIATGPLTSDKLTESIIKKVGLESLSFYDAAAPIIKVDSIDMSVAFMQSRYDKGDDDYINCPMNKEEYELFYQELISAESVELSEIDKEQFRVYEGCMPIEVMAKRGNDTIRYGPLKPVGLKDKRTDKRPYAVVQLRKENAGSTMYNMVGFQTNLKFGEQRRVFSMIPGLNNAEFIRYGVMHRNTFIDSPRLLDNHFRLKGDTNIYFAGQISGVEGYTESAAVGLYVGHQLVRYIKGQKELHLPSETMIGSLSNYISDETIVNFQPMGSNMGILPPLKENIRDKKLRYQAYAERSINSLNKAIKLV